MLLIGGVNESNLWNLIGRGLRSIKRTKFAQVHQVWNKTAQAHAHAHELSLVHKFLYCLDHEFSSWIRPHE